MTGMLAYPDPNAMAPPTWTAFARLIQKGRGRREDQLAFTFICVSRWNPHLY